MSFLEILENIWLFFQNIWIDFVDDFYQCFIYEDRWKYLTDGLLVTLQITVLSLIVGIILGFVVAIIRASHDKTGKLKFLNAVCNIYLTIIRGTPLMVQILLIYFGIFASATVPKLFVAVLAFGLNSGAYTAEIIRGGIMGVDNGQFEAGRSLGFNYIQTMWYIVLPQALKTVLPALGNEMIVLLKETSIAGYIAMDDLTKGGNIIRSLTYNAFLPLIAVAAIYLVIVQILTIAVSKLERRLRNSDH